jgi:hypothetical protein
MNTLRTDRYVLQCIFDMYQSSYPGPKNASGRGENDPYVSIDVPAIASKLDCNPELLFGRLYYHLDQKYRYKQDNGALVPLFHLQVGDKRHAVQFPYLASILAGLNQDFRRQVIPLGVSFISLGVSLASLVVSILRH